MLKHNLCSRCCGPLPNHHCGRDSGSSGPTAKQLFKEIATGAYRFTQTQCSPSPSLLLDHSLRKNDEEAEYFTSKYGPNFLGPIALVAKALAVSSSVSLSILPPAPLVALQILPSVPPVAGSYSCSCSWKHSHCIPSESIHWSGSIHQFGATFLHNDAVPDHETFNRAYSLKKAICTTDNLYGPDTDSTLYKVKKAKITASLYAFFIGSLFEHLSDMVPSNDNGATCTSPKIHRFVYLTRGDNTPSKYIWNPQWCFIAFILHQNQVHSSQ